jgi:hypothetical protein
MEGEKRRKGGSPKKIVATVRDNNVLAQRAASEQGVSLAIALQGIGIV